MKNGAPGFLASRSALRVGLLLLLIQVSKVWADSWTTGSTSDALVTSGTATKVGIGVTTPIGILDIRPSAATSGVGLPLILQAQPGGSNSAGGNLLLNSGPNGLSGSNGSILFGTGGGIASNGTFSSGEKMRIDPNGNVLIGTTTPNGGLLTVNGDVGISGAIRLGGDINFTQANMNIYGNTADGADNARLNISAGGGVNGNVNRGAYISLRGNENASPGSIQIAAGNVPGGNISMYTGNGVQALSIDANQLITGVTSKWTGNVSVVGNLNIGNQTNVPNYSVNAYNKIASVGPAGGIYHFGSGDPSFLPSGNTQSIQMVHAVGEGFISVTRTGTSPFVPFRIYTSDTKRYEVDAAGNHTFFGPVTVTGNATFSGFMGQGGATPQQNTLYNLQGSPPFTGPSEWGITSQPTFNSMGTNTIAPIYAQLTTANSAFTTTNGIGIKIDSPNKGASNTIANLYGLKIENQTGGGTNYAIHTGSGLVHLGDAVDISSTLSVTGNTTISSALSVAGNTTISSFVGQGGATPQSNTLYNLQGSPPFTGPSEWGITSQPTFNSLGTNTIAPIYAQLTTANSAFTTTNGIGIKIDSPVKGASNTITNLYGLKIENQTGGGTNYAIHTGNGLVHFGDAVDMSSTLSVTGTTTFLGSRTQFLNPSSNSDINLGTSATGSDRMTFGWDPTRHLGYWESASLPKNPLTIQGNGGQVLVGGYVPLDATNIFQVLGSERVLGTTVSGNISTEGKAAIGTVLTSASAALSVKASDPWEGQYDNTLELLGASTLGNNPTIHLKPVPNGPSTWISAPLGGGMQFGVNEDDNQNAQSGVTPLVLTAGGNVALATNTSGQVIVGSIYPNMTPGIKIDVEGDARVSGTLIAQTVKTNSWGINPPDYVFEKGYKLASLDHVEKYVAEKGHLPDIPSAKEIKKDGIDLADMNMKLLRKVEELTLYTIQQKKELVALTERLERLERSPKGASK